MAILIDKNTSVICQGMTGAQGTLHCTHMIEYGTNIVAGVTPGKGGGTHLDRPIYNTVSEAVRLHKVDATVIFVPPLFAADSILEAIDAEIPLIVCITENIPLHDMMRVKRQLQHSKSRLVGPNCPGLTTPGECKVGIIPDYIHLPGSVGVVSRSGTLTYEAVHQLTQEGLGQSTCVGIGGDPIKGLDFVDCLELFFDDPKTKAVVLIGEIGGISELKVAEYVTKHPNPKPVVFYIAGRSAPKGKRMGHAGALISNADETAAGKIDALEKAGCIYAGSATKIGLTMRQVLDQQADEA